MTWCSAHVGDDQVRCYVGCPDKGSSRWKTWTPAVGALHLGYDQTWLDLWEWWRTFVSEFHSNFRSVMLHCEAHGRKWKMEPTCLSGVFSLSITGENRNSVTHRHSGCYHGYQSCSYHSYQSWKQGSQSLRFCRGGTVQLVDWIDNLDNLASRKTSKANTVA